MDNRLFPNIWKKPDARVTWHRVYVVPRTSEYYALWERWHSHELFWLHNAILNPYGTEAQNRVSGIAYFHHWLLSIKDWESKMSKQNGNKKEYVSIDRWVTLRLDEDDKAVLSGETPTLRDILDDFGSLVFAGYRLSVSWDAFSQAVQASLVCADKDNPNAGIGVSARHPDIDMALTTLLYKVQKMGDQPWENFLSAKTIDNWG